MATSQNLSEVLRQSQPVAPAVVIPFKKSEPITQYELEEVMLLRNALRQREGQLALIETNLKARLEVGATVEEGVHVAELKETFRRTVAWKSVAADLADTVFGEGKGTAYCDEVLAATVPDRYVSLVIR
ncbi:MAG TPA: hypothetical protein VIW23_01575 [Candidatus Acidoferrum sp.]|jgi:hypothetical protein